MQKDFSEWHKVKTSLHHRRDVPTFGQREIWWCSVGANIGHEVDGKGEYYSRPVLVVRKFNPHIFWGVALTTQMKDNLYYHPIQLNGRSQCVMLSHLRLWESRRLMQRMGKLSTGQFEEVRTALKAIL